MVAISRFFRRLLGGQAIRRAGQHGLAVGIAGGALDVVNRTIYLLTIYILISFKPYNWTIYNDSNIIYNHIYFQDVGDLFRSGGLENHFSSVIEALYEGKRFVSQNVVLNKVFHETFLIQSKLIIITNTVVNVNEWNLISQFFRPYVICTQHLSWKRRQILNL